MRNNIIYISISLATCVIVGVVYSFYRYYAPPQPKQSYMINTTPDDTIRIAFIGDSWAFMHKEHECKIATILQDSIHTPVKVHSYGVCGLTSKEIYENIFRDDNFRLFMSKRQYRYCYVSAGINDTYKKMSTSYYQQSMDGIIRFLLANHIHPILQEIPDYDIQISFEMQKLSKKMLRHLSIIINSTPLDCKQIFRDALDELIQEKGYSDKLSILRYKSWNDNGKKDLNTLYRNDRLHLNDRGYTALDSAIAKEILTCISSGHNNEFQLE